jgi:hypothetical protein
MERKPYPTDVSDADFALTQLMEGLLFSVSATDTATLHYKDER